MSKTTDSASRPFGASPHSSGRILSIPEPLLRNIKGAKSSVLKIAPKQEDTSEDESEK